MCTSCDPKDLAVTDEIAANVLEEIAASVSDHIKQQYSDNIHWIKEAGKHKMVRALPKQIIKRGHVFSFNPCALWFRLWDLKPESSILTRKEGSASLWP